MLNFRYNPITGVEYYADKFRLKKHTKKAIKLFEINPDEGSVTEVAYEEDGHFIAIELIDGQRVAPIIKPNCFYMAAMNMKNAIRKFKNEYLS